MSTESLAVAVGLETSGPAIRPHGTWIYFLAVNNGERIKIGHSTKGAAHRSKAHAKSLAGEVKIDILCEVHGKVADESAVHRYFDAIRIPGEKELFRPEPELIEYIRWLRDQWFVAMPTMDKIEREAIQPVDSDRWIPLPDRRKQKPIGVLPGMLGLLDLGDREITGDDFYTNKVIIAAARKVMGRIDLAPASHAVANQVVQAARFFTVTDNGLAYPWAGRVWLNPPFSQWASWVPKVLSEWDSGRIEEMCVLSAMRTVTAQYFAPLLAECSAICIIAGRIKFWGGVAGDSPDDGHAVYYFGNRPESFREAFSVLGTVFFGVRSRT